MVTAPRADALVFFGATGDLAYKQIFPALQGLVRRGTLTVPVIGVAKSGWTLDDLRARARDSLASHGGVDEAAFATLSGLLRYIDGDYADPETFTRLRAELGAAEHPMHYLAIPPSLFGTVTQHLAASGCAQGARIVVEKPFGHDLASARALNETIHQVFPESSVYRIDHYLGKEAVQNMLYLRFANRLFEPLLNREHVQGIQITMAEAFGVAGRGHFYEETGAIRDVVQNHMLQVVALLMMEAPSHPGQEAIRDSAAQLLKSVRSLTPQDVVRGQMTDYHAEPGVAPGSTVETYAAARFHVDSWRWAGVPVDVRVGKELPVTCTAVTVTFRAPPLTPFGPAPAANALHLQLTPGVQVTLDVNTKRPGAGLSGEAAQLVLHQQAWDGMAPYERLLGDALAGDATLFAREDEVEEAWRIVDAVLTPTPPLPYAPGTWGPAAADALLGADGPWINPVPDGGGPPPDPATPAAHGSAANPAPRVTQALAGGVGE
ncbi:glucose-6-phosphate 1-dehydrogenase [Deinococcus metalli]|uniref:Glucose-6-phosphate 1-dehydrogenase n=1 Tax=Deinococcus metalli TaxID=1141878 RepID=A0A7W8KG01_9DEIO|nr:glucose-6-phosphate dehydrogenase [Deinococcus metalli]MBB5376418.1 glucose-6-phosphate 1-dehydrogenase [Deinococcus metalli]GHF44206.1 glucose-6-phosphate 1-dehydrogenase [Deinococcus metalli]